MVFQVPAAKASIKQNRFEFQLPGAKKVWSLPKLQYLSPDLSRRIRTAAIEAQEFIDENGEVRPDAPPEKIAPLSEIQTEILEHYCPGLSALLEGEDQVTALIEAWQEASKVSVGESDTSPQS